MTSFTKSTRIDYVEQLLAALEDEFQFARYKDKMRFFYRPKVFRKPLANFQWVKQTNGLQIARCAQPNYGLFKGDKDHGFDEGQIKFLKKNNINTIISLNSKQLKTKAAITLAGNAIHYHHIKTADFTALSTASHLRIYEIVRARRNMGGILFYCGYGQGRTGTAVAAVMLRYIMMTEAQILMDLSPQQLHDFLITGFGVEKVIQTNSIADYLTSFATVEPEAPNMRPRSLSDVSYCLFENNSDRFSKGSYESLYLPPLPLHRSFGGASRGSSHRSLPPLPSGAGRPLPPLPNGGNLGPPPLPARPNNVISAQSLDPIGKLRNSAHTEFGRLPSVYNRTDARTPLANGFLSNDGSVNLESFYFKRMSDNISV